jgi:hypothetical protein
MSNEYKIATYSFAVAEAVRVVFNHEKIPFESAVGAGSVIVILVPMEHKATAQNVLRQWKSAIAQIQI